MNRRQMLLGSAAAATAARGFAKNSQTAATTAGASAAVSAKKILKYSRTKAANKISSENRKTKYLTFMTAWLSLGSDQVQQADQLFTAAVAARSSAKTNMKALQKAFRAAAKSGNVAAIEDTSTAIGNLKAQALAERAKLNLAFFGVLNADQQSKLTQYRSA